MDQNQLNLALDRLGQPLSLSEIILLRLKGGPENKATLEQNRLRKGLRAFLKCWPTISNSTWLADLAVKLMEKNRELNKEPNYSGAAQSLSQTSPRMAKKFRRMLRKQHIDETNKNYDAKLGEAIISEIDNCSIKNIRIVLLELRSLGVNIDSYFFPGLHDLKKAAKNKFLNLTIDSIKIAKNNSAAEELAKEYYQFTFDFLSENTDDTLKNYRLKRLGLDKEPTLENALSQWYRTHQSGNDKKLEEPALN